MRKILIASLLAMAAASRPAHAAGDPVTVENYYRIRWGSGTEFGKLFQKNELPVLNEMRRLGFIRSFQIERPFTHMEGGPRWDYRVRITYRDADAGVVSNGAYDEAEEQAIKRLFKNTATRDREEIRRFELMDAHWDVFVMPVSE